MPLGLARLLHSMGVLKEKNETTRMKGERKQISMLLSDAEAVTIAKCARTAVLSFLLMVLRGILLSFQWAPAP